MALTGIFTDSGGTQFRKVSGVLRNTNGTWTILNDSTHTSLNMSSVTADTKAVYLTFPQANCMDTFVVAPDETYSSLGIFCGASVVVNKATISIYRMSGGKIVLVNPKTLVTQWGNLWIDGWFYV